MDTDYLHSFRHRMQSRLERVKSVAKQLAEDKKSTLDLIMQFGGHIGTPEEVHQLREQVDALSISCVEIVNDLIDELDIIEKFNWQSVAEIQEKCTSLVLAAYEEPLCLKALNDRIFDRLMEAVRRSLKASEAVSDDCVDGNKVSIERYSTPSLEAMKSAIQNFWLHHDDSKPPTQKAVSNYIAEQLGKPIRDRFTDELARAIKPE